MVKVDGISNIDRDVNFDSPPNIVLFIILNWIDIVENVTGFSVCVKDIEDLHQVAETI